MQFREKMIQYILNRVRNNMKYIHMLFTIIRKIFVAIWNFFSLFFGFPYEEQAKKMKDYDMRGKDNPKSKHTVYRANKVSKDKE